MTEPGLSLSDCDVFALGHLRAAPPDSDGVETCRLWRTDRARWEVEVVRNASCFDLRRDGDTLTWLEVDSADPSTLRVGYARTDGTVLDSVEIEDRPILFIGHDARLPLAGGGFAFLSRADERLEAVMFDSESRPIGRAPTSLTLETPFDRIVAAAGPDGLTVLRGARGGRTIEVASWDEASGGTGESAVLVLPDGVSALGSSWRPVYLGGWVLPVRRDEDERAALAHFAEEGVVRELVLLEGVITGDAELVPTNQGALLFYVETRFRPPRELVDEVLYAQPIICG